MEEVVHASVFYEISALLMLSVIGGYLGMFLRQPLVVSFIMMGILVGPSFLNIVQSSEHIDLLAHLGISLLLFVVGLKLDLQLIRTTGAVAAMTGKNLDDVAGDTLIADGLATTLAGAGGGSGTTTYAENIGVMAATRVYSTAAYWVASITATASPNQPRKLWTL